MIACFPMYDRPFLRPATDALWHAIAIACRARGIDAPAELSRHDDYVNLWAHPDLLVGMTCGKPYREGLYDTSVLIGNFDYGLAGCPPGYYNSHIITHIDSPRQALADFEGARFAFNGRNSESGYSCADRLFGDIAAVAGPMIVSGGHQISVEMVADQRADFAAIDAATWRYIVAEDPKLTAQVKIVTSTPPVTGLPLITRRPDLVPALYEAVEEGLASAHEAAQALQIVGFIKVSHDAYMELKDR